MLELSVEVKENLKTYQGFLKKWAQAINLVSRHTIQDVWVRHILDSAQIFSFLLPQEQVLDIGTGAGFPGLVLALMGHPQVRLIEPQHKRAVFLQEMIRVFQLPAVLDTRPIQNVPPEPFHVITSRAFCDLSSLFAHARPFLGPHSRVIAFQGRSGDKDLAACLQRWHFTYEYHPNKVHPQGRILVCSSLKDKKCV